MNLPFFIAGRYLISKKSRNVINLISGISIAGVTIGTMALIIVLSVFNGLESLIKSLFNSFDPDLKITLVEGKTFNPDIHEIQQIKNNPGVAVFTEVLEENALIVYRSRQAIITLMGVSDNYKELTGIDSLIVEGSFTLWDNDIPTGVIGYDLAAQLSVGLAFFDPMYIWVPKRSGGMLLNPASAFRKDYLFPRGIFSVQQDYDSKYLIVPISFARELLSAEKKVTAIFIKGQPGYSLDQLQKQLQTTLGSEFKIQNPYEQHEAFYQVMASEKWAIFLILGFILIIASFNTISSLTLLVLEKKKDMHILQSLGALPTTIRKVFLVEGLLITGIGIVSGLLLGALVCWAQMHFGIIRFPSEGSFIVDVYPLKMELTDFFLVGLLVSLIGWLASFIPVRILGKRYFSSFDGTELNS